MPTRKRWSNTVTEEYGKKKKSLALAPSNSLVKFLKHNVIILHNILLGRKFLAHPFQISSRVVSPICLLYKEESRG